MAGNAKMTMTVNIEPEFQLPPKITVGGVDYYSFTEVEQGCVSAALTRLWMQTDVNTRNAIRDLLLRGPKPFGIEVGGE